MKVRTKLNCKKLRDEMVGKPIFARSVRSDSVLDAMRSVPRQSFLPSHFANFPTTASLPIEEGQTISQPSIVAFMTEALALRGSEKSCEPTPCPAARQFDEYIWLDENCAVTPFETAESAGLPDTYPLECEHRHAVRPIARFVRCVTGLFPLIFAATLATSASPADARKGETLAKRWCATCHVVAADQQVGTTQSPVFATIARNPEFNEAMLAFLFLTPHPRMADMNLSRSEAADVAAYIIMQK
jgi:protein-L-isoaspartate(D-aspartate) O-methyltransferase (PCMT)